jgi:hypothetical protein
MFSVADQFVGTPVSVVTPLRCGPRQPGQLSAAAIVVPPAVSAAHMMIARRHSENGLLTWLNFRLFI